MRRVSVLHLHIYKWISVQLTKNSLLFMRFANGQSVCLLWKSWLWMAGGLIDLHYHILLLNLEGRVHKNRWWPINLQPPRRSASVPARRISKFILLKNQFLFSLCGLEFWPSSAVCQQDYLTERKISQQGNNKNKNLLKVSFVSCIYQKVDWPCTLLCSNT